MSFDFATLLAVFWTFAILSFLIKDNPLFKLVEHIFTGVASGYFFCTQFHQVLWPNLIQPFLSGEVVWKDRLMLLFPTLLSIFMLLRVIPGLAWISRWALAFVIGMVVGTNIPIMINVNILEQITRTIEKYPLAGQAAGTTVENSLFILGLVSVLGYFYFSIPHRGVLGAPLGALSRVGRIFMMVAFGAMFGNAVMGRVAILLGRVLFLLRDWLGLVS